MKKLLATLLSMTIILSGIVFTIPSAASADGTISNVVFNYYNGTATEIFNVGSERIITPGFTEPVLKEDGITDPSGAGYYSASNYSSYFGLFGDTNAYQYNYLYDAPDILKESSYIRLNKGWRYNTSSNRTNESNPNSNPDSTVLSFTINKTATVYYVFPASYSSINTYAPWLNSEGWEEECKVILAESNGNLTETDSIKKTCSLMKKKFTVENGSSVTVNIKGFSGNYFVPMVFVKFAGPFDDAAVTNGIFKKYDASTQATTNITLGSSNIITTGFTAPQFKEGAVTDSSSWEYYSTANLTEWFSVFSNTNYLKNNYFFSAPDYLNDAVYLRLDRSWREPRTDENTPNAMKTQSEVLTFDINNTANVYYVLPGDVSNATWLTDEGWYPTGDNAVFVESAGASDTDAIPAKHSSLAIYKKKFTATEESPVNVKIGGYYQNYYVPFVFVDWVDDSATKTVLVTSNEGGTVSKTGYNDVAIGDTFNITVTPDEISKIEYIKLNGEIVVSDKTGEYVYTTPEITADSAIEVKFKETARVTNGEFKFYNAATNEIDILKLDSTHIITSGFTDPVIKEGGITNPEAEGYYSTNNLSSWFSAFGDTNYSKYNYFLEVDDYLRDAVYLRLRKAWREPRTGANTPNAMASQSEVLTFDINKTANVYYVMPNQWLSTTKTHAYWLNDENWQVSDANIVFVEAQNNEGENPQPKDYLIYQKKFVVEEGKTETIKIGGFYQNYLVPMVFVDWVDEDTVKNVSVSKEGNGTVTKIGNNDAPLGSTFSVKITPDEGYAIEYVKLNGVEVISQYIGSTVYTTPVINTDMEIEVKFMADPTIPKVITAPVIFDYKDDVTDKLCGIIFATAADYEGYTLLECGIAYSATEQSPTLENGATKYKAYVGRNTLGQFGIKLYSSKFTAGSTYYATPYAIYKKTEDAAVTTVYGSSVSFTPQDSYYDPSI